MAKNYPFSILVLIIAILLLISTVRINTDQTDQVPPWAELTTPDQNLNIIFHKLHEDPETLMSVSSDYGNIVRESPAAVFHPCSVHDIATLIKQSYNQTFPFTIAARGQGHSTRGQAMARDGVVVDMATFRKLQTNGVGISVVYDIDDQDPLNLMGNYYADVGGEQLWIDVLHATLEVGLAPTSWTDYLYLTVGGTLSNAGISGQTFRYGPQITNVHQIDVVTGKGDFVTCSPHKNSELFHAVLGGFGQFGVITRARIALQLAPQRVKWVRLFYSDFSSFTRDQERLISIKNRSKHNIEVDYLEGIVLMHHGPINNWRSSFFPLKEHPIIASLITEHGIIYCLEVAKYYDDQSENDVDKEIQVMVQGLGNIPGFYYEKDVTYVEFLNRVRSGELKLQSQGLWDVPHPWLNLFIPKSKILKFNSGVFKDIILRRNITNGPVLVYPMNRNKWDDRMSACIPDEDVFYTIGFLHSSGFDDWKEFDTQNREILQFCSDAGIKFKQYLPQHSTEEEWKNHFGSKWGSFIERKNEFDPRMILSPGQKIFRNNHSQRFT